MTKYTQIAAPTAEPFPNRRTNAHDQWKHEAATRVHPANTDKGITQGIIEYPNGRVVRFQRNVG